MFLRIGRRELVRLSGSDMFAESVREVLGREVEVVSDEHDEEGGVEGVDFLPAVLWWRRDKIGKLVGTMCVDEWRVGKNLIRYRKNRP